MKKSSNKPREYRTSKQGGINHMRAAQEQPKVIGPQAVGNWKQYSPFFEGKRDRG